MKKLAFALTLALIIGAMTFVASSAQEGEKKPDQKPDQKAEAKKPELARSWSDQAQAAIAAGNLEEGIYLYRRWLEADPRDSGSWYNLACAYSLTKQKRKAMDALESAIEAGWDDWRHMERDSDLDSVRDADRYPGLIAKLKAKEESGKGEYVRHHVKFESTGLYAAYLPAGYDAPVEAEKQPREYKLVVTLHGAGSTETAHGAGFRTIMGEEDCIFIAPRAPFGIPTGGSDLGYVAWIPEARGTEWGTEQSMRQWCGMIDACVTDAMERYHVEGNKVFVVGHSMGGGASLCYTALYPERVKSVFCYAGYHVEATNTAAQLAKVAAAGVAVHISHCNEDPAVGFAEGEKAAKVWKEAGIKVTTHFFEAKSHSLIEPVREAMKAWADGVVRGGK